MKLHPHRIGDRIRALFSDHPARAIIIAPFIKEKTLRSITSILSDSTYLHCVTRWLPQDIIQRVSDLEVIDLIEERGNADLALVHNLHAKIFCADDRCLIGSANVTGAGFGDSQYSNLEAMVEVSIDDPGIASTLKEIEELEVSATREIVDQLRAVAMHSLSLDLPVVHQAEWTPFSFKPARAFALYSQHYSHPGDVHLVESDRIVLRDIYNANIMPGKSEPEFNEHIRNRLARIPQVGSLLDGTVDESINSDELGTFFRQNSMEGFSEDDMWRALVNWMTYFYEDRVMGQEITEVVLRRARRVT